MDMRNRVRGLAALCLLLWLFPALALAQRAVVDNGENPGIRLNLRSAPSREAKTLGKFVSGTPVEVLSDADDGWSKVRIGGGQHAVTGYMMTQYLCASSAIDARESRQVVSPYGTQSVVLRDHPSKSYDAVMMLMEGETVTVIGISGDFCYVQTEDSSVGCLAWDELK